MVEKINKNAIMTAKSLEIAIKTHFCANAEPKKKKI